MGLLKHKIRFLSCCRAWQSQQLQQELCRQGSRHMFQMWEAWTLGVAMPWQVAVISYSKRKECFWRDHQRLVAMYTRWHVEQHAVTILSVSSVSYTNDIGFLQSSAETNG